MSDNSRMGVRVVVIAPVLLMLLVTGCRAPVSAGRTPAVTPTGVATQAGSMPSEADAVATQSEVASLVAGFAEPQTPADPGYELLQQSDPATWFKAQLLQRVDVGAYLHSVAPQRERAAETAARALAAFDALDRSKGTTAALDVLQQAEFTDGSLSSKTRDYMWLEATVARLALLEPKGELATAPSGGSRYRLAGIAVKGDRATLTYSDAAGATVSIQFDLRRDANGNLKIVGWPNYAEVLGKLGPDVMGQWGD